METVQIVLDKKLLVATDRAARQSKSNRSAFVREALKAHLRKLDLRSKEELERQAYIKQPQTYEETTLWEAEQAWPEE